MQKLKEVRLEKRLTQQQAADYVGISLRSYKTYENEEKREGTLKYNYIVEKLLTLNPLDEEHGILELQDITRKCEAVFRNYSVQFCYLFGSYAKGTAKPDSDVDLLVATKVSGLKFFGLVEEIRAALNKRVDVLDLNQLNGNLELTSEILKDGIKIYG